MNRSSAVVVNLVSLVVVMALLWQAVTFTHGGTASSSRLDWVHATLHWQNASHHHHQDGSHHLDDSVESAQHMLSDHPSVSALPVVATSQGFPNLGSPAPGGLHPRPLSSPVLDGLFRPPRPLA